MTFFSDTLLGQETSHTRPPFWLMRQAGRYLPEYREVRAKAGGFIKLCLTPELAAEVTLQPIRRFGFDAAILFSDILMVPHGLGQKLWFAEGEGPRLEPVTDPAALDLAGIETALEPIYTTVRTVRAALPNDVELIGFAGSPWTVACYMVEGQGGGEFTAIKALSYTDPAKLQAIIDVLVEASILYLTRQIQAGAGVIQLFDSWAGNLSARQFATWVIEPTARIVSALKAKFPHVGIIGFPRLAGGNLLAYAAETGVDGLGLDTGVPLDWAVKAVPHHITLQGNLDPLLLAAGGPALDQGIDDILTASKQRPFIFNLGHGIIPSTPPENVAHVAERVKFGKAA